MGCEGAGVVFGAGLTADECVQAWSRMSSDSTQPTKAVEEVMANEPFAIERTSQLPHEQAVCHAEASRLDALPAAPGTRVALQSARKADASMTRITFSLTLALAILSNTGMAQPSQPAVLNVDAEEGRVSVSSEGSALSQQALDAIRTYAQARLGRSPLREHGKLHVALRGPVLADLTASLRGVNLADPRTLDANMDRFFDSYFSQPSERPLAKPVEVVVGRHFELGANSWSHSIVAIGASGRIDAPIADVIAIGSQIELGPSAEVTDRLIHVGSQVELRPGARVTGQEVSLWLPQLEDWGAALATTATTPAPAPPSLATRLAWSLFGLLASFGLGSLWLHVLPTFRSQVLARMRQRPWRALGMGFLHYLAIIPVALLLVLTIIGIALLPLYAMGLGLLVWVGYVAGAALIGSLLVRAWRSWQQLLLGLALLSAAAWVPVLGGLVGFLVVTAGVGAIMLQTYERIGAWRGRRPSANTQPSVTVTSEPAAQQG